MCVCVGGCLMTLRSQHSLRAATKMATPMSPLFPGRPVGWHLRAIRSLALEAA